MNSNINFKMCGIVYFLIDIMLQGYWIVGIAENEWIYKFSLHNSFLLWCFAVGIFGESKLMGWFALIGMLVVIILVIKFWFAFLKNKKSFLIPLCLTFVNVIVHIIFYWKEPLAYVGLLYKIFGCAIYAYLMYGEYMKRNN